jgi:hypothetical protein
MAKSDKTVYVSDLRKPTNWRWERARELSEQRKKGGVRFYDDEITSEAVRYLNKKKGGAESYELAKEFPAIYEADVIHTEAAIDRWTIEALLIADEAIERIVNYTGASTELIETYEQLFFDVRSRLKNTGFINMRVLGNNMREIHSTDPDGMWKMLGFNGGPQILYALWSCKLPDEKVIQWFKGMRKWEIVHGSARAAKARTANGFNTGEIIDGAMKLDELEMAAAINKPADSTTNNLLTQLNYTIANITPEVNKGNPKRELRADEKVKAQLEAAGIKLDEFIDVTPQKEETNVTRKDQ